ncbi:DUF2867 domain-containing protein [Rubellicoccus peritrichatus]|uniref:DUF2867 domain-containing protein n=1 Tax=Rubellicoccus peritrichatus TaxID=3080537 RepID=A0AAQ3QS64_9BACT|nr:DUF2867 domain-containing protein [Puniceicoccus sp. CR14]WOO42068.1 DUF2867 domain-containing protein [Puniceicoccus sp. CR14]
MRILVTGATGYIGGRMIPRLLGKGHSVAVLVRDPRRIEGRDWFHAVEVIVGDLLDRDGEWMQKLVGFDAAYYFVHSMSGGGDFQNLDVQAASNFCQAAKGIPHTIYLGGLLPKSDKVSRHLTSRAETGETLRQQLAVTEFRAGPIIGSGSASFEMVRYLTERLPIMVTPKWVANLVQPIAVRDVLAYLIAALDKEPLGVVEIGIPEPITFKEMMLGYASSRGLSRWIYPLPVLTPGLAARWVGFVTPIPNSLAVPLIEGVVHPVVADVARAQKLFPKIEPIGYDEAVEYALIKITHREVETRWSGALGSGSTYRLSDWEGTIREERTIHVKASPEATFRAFCSLGGERGWLAMDWAWKVRGWMDKLSGGPGLRRGRRDPVELLPGEPLDFWRVEEVRSPKILRLRAEMKVPGRAWLQWEAWEEGEGTRLVQCALFRPQGFPGVIYWYSLYLIHKYIFSAMVRGVAHIAESE